MALPQTCPFVEVPGQGSHTRIQAEYIWIGGSGKDVRCKTMSLDKVPESLAQLRVWNFDGACRGPAGCPPACSSWPSKFPAPPCLALSLLLPRLTPALPPPPSPPPPCRQLHGPGARARL